MKKTNFTKFSQLFSSFLTLFLVGMCLNLSAQTFTVSNVSLATSGLTGCPPAGLVGNATQVNIPITVNCTDTTKTLGSIDLNYCSAYWTGDWDFYLAAPGSATAYKISNGTGYGLTNSSASFKVFNTSNCSASYPVADISSTTNTGNKRSIVPFDCPRTRVSPNGTWILIALNTYGASTFTDEVGFLTSASLNFVDAPKVTGGAISGVTGVGGTVQSVTGPAIVSGTNCQDTVLYTIQLSAGATAANATIAAPTALAPTTSLVLSPGTGPVAGPYNVGKTRIRVDSACYNPIKVFVTVVNVLAAPIINCPANKVVSLAPGECTAQLGWACPTSNVNIASTLKLSQQTANGPINNAWRCVPLFSGNKNRFGRLFDAIPLAAGSDCNPATSNTLTLSTINCGAWSNPSSGKWKLNVYKYTGTAPAAGECPSLYYPNSACPNLVLVGTSDVTLSTTTATQTLYTNAPLVTPMTLQRGVVYYAELESSGNSALGGAGYWEIGSNSNAETRCTYTAAPGGCQADPTSGFDGGLNIHVPLELNFSATSNGISQISGPKQNDLVVPGIYNICYRVTDATGAITDCCFNYEVRPYSGTVSNTLVCNDFLNVSLDTLCSAVLGADMLLEGGPYKCYDNYKVEVSTSKTGPWRDNIGSLAAPAPVANAYGDNKAHIFAGAIGKTYYYRVVDKANTSNTCWGQFIVEDKVAPVLACPADMTIKCNESLEPANLTAGSGCSSGAINATGASVGAPKDIPIVVNLPWNTYYSGYTFTVKNTGSAWTGDQRCVLVAPNGNVYRLNGDQLVLANNVAVGPGVFGCANTGSEVTYSNASIVSPATLTCANPVVGTCKPLDALPMPGAGLATGPGVCKLPATGSSFNGTWILRVWDDFPGDALGSMQGIFNFISVNGGTTLPTGLFLGNFAEYSNRHIFNGVEVLSADNGVNTTKIGDKKYRVKAGILDACTETTLSYNDVIVEFPCSAASNIIKQVTRKWSAVDASGNTATCTQKITVTRADLNNLEFPLSWDGQPGNNRVLNICSDFYTGNPNDYYHGATAFVKLPNGFPSPKAGVVSVDTIYTGEFDNGHFGEDTLCLKGTGMPSGALCGTINMLYTDTRLDICGSGANAGYKLLRDWRVLDWCTGQIKNYTQVIKVMDMTAPSMECPVDVIASTDALNCLGSGTFPTPVITDICSSNNTYSVYYNGGAAFPDGGYIGQNPDGSWRYTGFPCGTYNFKYVAKDECGNSTECTTFDLTIRDLTVPVPVCRSLTQVTLTNTQDDPYTTVKECGLTRVEAFKFDEGSWDNCGPVYFKVKRVQRPSTYDGNGNFDDYAWFNCEDVGTDIDVILRVYDVQPNAGHVNDSYKPTRNDGCGPQGNFNDCVVKVRVEDLVNPTLVCPPSITVTCSAYDFSNALPNSKYPAGDSSWFNKYFGRIVVSDCGGTFSAGTFTYNNGSFNVTAPNGSAFDNCYANIQQDVSYELECGVGKITRTFKAVDKGGRQSNPCTQTITVQNPTPFYIDDTQYTDPGPDKVDPCDGTEYQRNYKEDWLKDQFDIDKNFIDIPVNINYGNLDDIIWPDQLVELPNCTGINGIGTECARTGKDAGKPKIQRNDKCDLVAMTYADEVFPIEPNVCVKILRTWTVIDWCQNKPYGKKWTYTQVIKLVDAVAPDFTGNTCKNDTICQYPTDCGPEAVTLCATAKDNCTPDANLKYSYVLDLNNDGTPDFKGNSSCITVTKANGLKYGRHMLTWAVEDNCGNVKTCTKTFTIRDCKKPTPVAKLLSIELMPNNCSAVLEASKVNNFSWDNCTPMANLRFRLAKAGEYNANMTLDQVLALNDYVTFVSEVGTQTIALFVIDADNNFDYVETFVVVQSNMNPDCVGGTGTAAVSGTIQTEAKENVEKVDVKVNGISKQVTDGTGFINMLLSLNKTYTVAPEKLIEARNGVTTADLVAINKHILGIENLSSPYRRIAADINNDGKISTADMVELRKLILFINDNFTSNTSWKMVDKAYTFTTSTPEKETYPLNVTIAPLQSASSANFVGVKIGDVNGSAKANNLVGDATERSAGTLVFDVQDANMKAGETRTVEFKAQDIKDINAYQFTMNFNTEALEVVSVAGLNENNFGLSLLNQGAITLSNDAAAADQVIAVTFKAKQAVQLSNALSVGSNFTAAEAYTVNGDKFDVALSFNGTIAGNFQLLQNQPNPFNGKTVIGFVLPEASNATLTIFDATGRTLKVVKGDFAKGYNEVVVEKSELNTVGILSYRLTSDKFSATKQMIIAE